jgi:hypothetical protein
MKCNIPLLNCVYITITRGDHITRKADIFFKMWRHCYLRLNLNQPHICSQRYTMALSLVASINLTLLIAQVLCYVS